jgi:hypothetical protein
MTFSKQEIETAKRLRTLALPWHPQPGHFVWDEMHMIEAPSPFQDQVYFILDLKHFLRRAGSIEALKAAMIWLPTWHDARAILHHIGAAGQDIADALKAQKAVQRGTELVTLYQLIAARLQDSGQGVKPAQTRLRLVDRQLFCRGDNLVS